jgi:superfamily II DNA/RNA helicase
MAVRRSPSTFHSFDIPAAVVAALAAKGITSPTPIQQRTLPDALAGRDVLGRGQTGSGKTYAFLVPLVTRLAAVRRQPAPGRPRALVLVPTRELATQVQASLTPIADALGLRSMAIFGGVAERPQIAALRSGVDIVIACPGRLAALMEAGRVDLGGVEISVLDEADHMADLGFLPVVRRLLTATPRQGQRLLFSATLDGAVDALVRAFLRSPVTHQVDTDATPVRLTHHALQVQREELLPVLADLTAAPGRALVFTRTKHAAKRLTRQLLAAGVSAVELHGNLAQNARDRNLRSFADGTAGTLVATDIAARGIHVDDVALVIHVEPPAEYKAYLHRSGRTARAGATGTVVTLFTAERLGEVQDLARRAGIRPATAQVRPGSPLLSDLAPGVRTFASQPAPAPVAARTRAPGAPAATVRHSGDAGRHATARRDGATRGAAAFSRRSRAGR